MRRRCTMLAVALTVAGSTWVGPASGQVKPAPDKPGCDAQRGAVAPQKVAGQVVRVDTAEGKIAVRGDDGTTHEFRASRETLDGMKVGDRIEARLRTAPSC